MSYQDELKSKYWDEKRVRIIKQQKKCQKCGVWNNLQLHHKRYVVARKAWEYPDNDFILLCGKCHEFTHGNEKILLFTSAGEPVYSDKSFYRCPRCHGIGTIDRYWYYMDGICFTCNGEGFLIRDRDEYEKYKRKLIEEGFL